MPPPDHPARTPTQPPQGAVERDEPRSSLPRTQRDPLPHTPDRTLHAETGASTGVGLSGGHEQAKRVAVRLVHALLTQDAAKLRELFARRVIGIRSRRMLQRRDIVAECLAHARYLQWDSELTVEAVVDLDALETRRVGMLDPTDAEAEGLRPADIMVRMPLHPLGPPPPARCFQRSFHTAQIYVRTGPEPRIVAVFP